MTGPEHLKEAERLLDFVKHCRSRDDELATEHNLERVPLVLAEAQVHATLALAATTAILR